MKFFLLRCGISQGRITFFQKCPSQVLSLGPAYSARPTHHSAPDRTARAQPTSLDPRTLRTEHKVREISCSSLENCSFQFRLISNQGLYIIKVSSVWFDTFFVEFSVGLLNISWPKMDLQMMRYLHIKEQDQKSNIWPM